MLTKIKEVQQHPHLIRPLARLLGYRIDGTEEDLPALARLSLVIAFHTIEKRRVRRGADQGDESIYS